MNRDALRLLRATLRGRRRDVTGLLFWAAVEAFPVYAWGRLVASAVDQGFLAGRPARGFATLALLAVTVGIGAWGARQTFRRLTVLVEPFRDELVVRTVTGAIRRSTRTGQMPDTGAVGRLTRHVEVAREALASLLLVAQSFVVLMASALLGLVTLVPAAGLLVLPPMALGIGVFVVSLGRMTASKRAAILADEGIAVSATAMAAGLRDVVASGGERIVEAEVGGYVDAEAAASRRVARVSTIGAVAIGVGGWVPLLLLLAGGPWLRRNGASTGAFLGALTYVLEGIIPALQSLVRGVGDTGAWLTVALGRIAEIRDPHDEPEPGAAGEAAGADGYGISLRGLTFRYGAQAQPIVDGLDLDIAEGDHLAVVGPSGAGKSTLAALVAGMLHPEQGEVVLGGAPVLSLDRATLATRRVLIPQEAYVFADTLRDNLVYLNPSVAEARLDQAVDLLGARALVERLGGYDATLDPASLSAGERQLLSLVRAFVAEAPVVLLDEATCHLDPAAERRVEEAFARRGGTLVVVAHRISSAMRARRILVLDGGVATVGTHRELLDRSELYRELVGSWSAEPPAGGPPGGARWPASVQFSPQ